MNTTISKFYFVSIILLALIIVNNANVYANSDNDNKETANEFPIYKKSLGFGAGFTTGYGLSFRYTHRKYGAQINFAPNKSEYEDKISLGITFIYNLYQSKGLNFFIYQGNHYLYEHIKFGYGWPMTPSSMTSHNFYNGLGIGFEFVFAERLSLNIMGGYASHKNFQSISVTAETALYFRF